MSSSGPKREGPAWLRALGRRTLPPRLFRGSRVYTLDCVFKDDFFAVTARYDSPDGGLVLKANRQASLFGVPLRWIGRRLRAREEAAFQRLKGVEGVPAFLGRWEDTGVLHAFIPGHAMRKGERVPDGFHARLRDIIRQIHARGMAYVDLEKCENVLVGADGRPHLVDFQIAFVWPWEFAHDAWLARFLRRRFQEGDLYHLVKLQRRTRPDELSAEALAHSYRRPWYVHLHRWLTRPFTLARRALLDRIDPRRGTGERGRAAEETAD